MKLKQRTLNIILILIYLVFTLITAYTLFSLQDNLVYSSYALSVSDMVSAQPVLIKLNLIVGVTLLIGLGALIFSFKNRNDDVIYVEKKRIKDLENNGGEENDKEEDKAFSTSFLNEILKTEKDQNKILEKSLQAISKKLDAGVSVLYQYKKSGGKNLLEMQSSYALSVGESQVLKYEMGEGLVGQAAKERKSLVVDDIPEGYIKVVSGLGSASPTHLIVSPIELDKKLYGVVEIATFSKLNKEHLTFVDNCFHKIMEKLNGKTAETKKATKKPESQEETKEVKKSSKGKSKKA